MSVGTLTLAGNSTDEPESGGRPIVTAAPTLPGMPAFATDPEVEQLALIGQPQPIRVPARLWRS
ncbi:hypothetical protein R1CP_16425 [Rhodococcus opacus]|uniref:Uncharacterized protein n=1 Tax=Rhodococcus opacus TaxID=37919 RepID=A0A1B1K5Q9_RHOOP|nr:hypothetical protein R1CP_16425 [Rhodococcus opacus]